VNVAAAVGSALARVPTRLVLRIDSQLSRAPELRGTVTQRRRLRRARQFFPRADAIVAISRGVAEDVARELRLPRERVHVIYNPVTTPRLLARAQQPLDHPWFAPGSPPVVLGVGRLVAQKDFATLLRAFARVREQRDARLLLLGEGRERDALEALVRELSIEPHVRLPGAVDNPYPYMTRAALLAVSSAWEGFGNVLVEALACGCPVASTDCPSGPSEILEGGLYGPLSPVGDAEGLARSIVALLDGPPERDGLRKRAELFSEERSAERYLRVLLG
jgi:glycosyltransferase involved in cell wall biosynthesis